MTTSDPAPIPQEVAGSGRKLPQTPAHPRKLPNEKSCSGAESPPMPGKAGSAKTGLSRRRSRVESRRSRLYLQGFCALVCTRPVFRRAAGATVLTLDHSSEP
jgi:hypothetical protein